MTPSGELTWEYVQRNPEQLHIYQEQQMVKKHKRLINRVRSFGDLEAARTLEEFEIQCEARGRRSV